MRLQVSTSTPAVAFALVACGVALATREPATASVLVLVAVGVVAMLLPAERDVAAPTAVAVGVLAAGVAGFAVVRLASEAVAVAGAGVAASAVAAVAEEAFFRRALYGRLLRFGALVAVVGSAVAFAVVHLPLYGPQAGVVNLGAGLVFGWQRWATGRWSVPAVTHAFANLVAFW